jgi:riboflavin kinase / FMN adenylyltransferase
MKIEFPSVNFEFVASVIGGETRGRDLGFPTANLDSSQTSEISSGVYAVTVVRTNDKLVYCGMMNVGQRPTFSESCPATEVHIFDFNENIYGEELKIRLHFFLRGEKTFENADALVSQLKQDELNARSLLSNLID